MEPNKKSKLLVVVPEDSTGEYREQVKKEMTAKMGDACEIVVGTSAELGYSAPMVIIDDPIYTIQNRVMHDYIPMPRPSKKELRTSPYAKFDKFHNKRKRK